MKYSFMSFSCPNLNLEQILTVARQYGYDAIEPRIEAEHAHGIELDIGPGKRGEIRRRVVDSGVPLCCVATSRRYSNPDTAKREVEDSLRCIDLAADVGAPRLRVFGGTLPEGLSREEAIELVADSLRSVADHAQHRGVTVCLETHDDWTNPAHVSQVMTLVDHPAIAVNWDVMHPVRVAGWPVDRAFRTLAPWIGHSHVHDGVGQPLELRPMGQGEVDTRRAIELLKTLPYDGFLSGEWIDWEPYEIHLPRELATLRQYDRETS